MGRVEPPAPDQRPSATISQWAGERAGYLCDIGNAQATMLEKVAHLVLDLEWPFIVEQVQIEEFGRHQASVLQTPTFDYGMAFRPGIPCGTAAERGLGELQLPVEARCSSGLSSWSTRSFGGLAGCSVRPDGHLGALGEESFFSLPQENVLDTRRWENREELRLAIVAWIETKYNRRRRQRVPDKLTPEPQTRPENRQPPVSTQTRGRPRCPRSTCAGSPPTTASGRPPWTAPVGASRRGS